MAFDLDDDELKATRIIKKLDKMLEVGEDDWRTNETIPQNDIKEILTEEQKVQ